MSNTMISKVSAAFDELKVDASRRLVCNRKVIATMLFTEVLPEMVNTIDHTDEISYLQKHKTLYGKRYTRVYSTFNMSRLAIVVLFFLFGTTMQAQIPVCGSVSGTCSKPLYETYYVEETKDMAQLFVSIPQFPNWEVWTKNGYTYVIRKTKQRFAFLSYAKFDCIVLQLPITTPKEDLVNR